MNILKLVEPKYEMQIGKNISKLEKKERSISRIGDQVYYCERWFKYLCFSKEKSDGGPRTNKRHIEHCVLKRYVLYFCFLSLCLATRALYVSFQWEFLCPCSVYIPLSKSSPQVIDSMASNSVAQSDSFSSEAKSISFIYQMKDKTSLFCQCI